MSKFAQKTILALAVAAAASTAHALSPLSQNPIDVGGSLEHSYSGSSFPNNDVIFVGDGTRAAGQNGLLIQDLDLRGDFQSYLHTFMAGNNLRGLSLTSSGGGRQIVSGVFESMGNHTIDGNEAVAIDLNSLLIGIYDQNGNVRIPTADELDDWSAPGNLLNSGSVFITADAGHTGQGETIGLRLNDSILAGDFFNTGAMVIKANNATGIKIIDSEIRRDIWNYGNLNVQGENAKAIHLKDLVFGKDVINAEGSVIQVSGEGSSGLVLENTNVFNLENHGSISATGDNAVGVHLINSMHHDSGRIKNTGVIYGEDTGIMVTTFGADQPGQPANNNTRFTINQLGGRIEGSIAIDGNMQTNVNFNGGEIIGDIEGVKAMNVNGDATLRSEFVEAYEVNIESGRLTTHGATEFAGNMSIGNGAALVAFVADGTNEKVPMIIIDGRLNLATGSTVGVTTSTGQFTKRNVEYKILSADEIVNGGASVTPQSALLEVSNARITDTDIFATLSLAQGSRLDANLTNAGVSARHMEMAKQFQNYVLSNLSDQSPLYQRFISATDAELVELVRTLEPDVLAGEKVAVQTAARQAAARMNQRTSALGANSGEMLADTGVWLEALHSDGHQNERGGFNAFNTKSNGFILGADGKLNENTTLGVAFSHVKTDVNTSIGSKSEVTNNMLSAYGGWEQGALSVNGSLTYGVGQVDTKRYVAGETIKGDNDSQFINAELFTGYTLNLNEQVAVTPTAGTRYTRIMSDSYKEKGSAAALDVASQNLEVFDVGAGVKVDATFGDFQPYASAMAYYDLAQDQGNTTSAFVLGGNSFVTDGAPATKWTYETSVGVNWTKGNYTLGVAYDYTRKADFHADTFSLKARYDF